MIFRIIWILFLVACPTEGAFSQPLSLWKFEGGSAFLEAEGSSRRFFYESPSREMVEQEARHGQKIFSGRRDRNKYIGEMFVFSEKCGMDDYKVEGPISADQRKVTLVGVAPVRDGRCKTLKFEKRQFTFEFVSTTVAGGTPTHLCYFEMALVPCIELQPEINTASHTYFPIRFRAIRFVPLWPNQSIFGGMAKERPDFVSHTPDEIVDKSTRFYNRSRPYDSSIATIVTTQPAREVAGAEFVDTRISHLDSHAVIEPHSFPRLADVGEAYWGGAVYDQWAASKKFGVICDSSSGALSARTCAFVRDGRKPGYDSTFEYCTFGEEEDVRSEVACTVVAAQQGDKRSILATRYTAFGPQGAGGEGIFSCVVPGTSLEELMRIAPSFLKEYAGLSARISARHSRTQASFSIEALNKEDKQERVFVRSVVRGEVARLHEGAPVAQTFSEHLNEPVVSVLTFFTISVSSSDNVTDYREPNTAMGQRIRNRFQSRFEQWAKSISPRATCEVTG